MKRFLETIGYTVIMTLAIYWSRGNLKLAFQVSVTVMGIIVFVYSTIGVYENLKNVEFKFSCISKQVWIKLGVIYLCVWSSFILILSEGMILVPCVQIPLILIGLLIYDRIGHIFKK